MANKDFKVKNGLDIQAPLPVSMGGTGQTSTTNTLNSLLPPQSGNTNKVLQTDGTNTQWYTVPAAYTRGATGSRPGSPTAGDLYFNTDYNYFEQYTSLGWFPVAAVPGTPTGVTATNQGSGRAYNNGQASVAFTPNTSAGYPSSFIVTPTPSTSPTTFTGTSSPVTVTGLASSTQYTYTVQATSAYGTSSASSASSGVTATTVPQAPTLTAAAASDSTATITITPGSTGGAAISQYSIVSDPVTTTQTTANTTYTFTGLTVGTSYTFTATATNANGTSASSSASNSITPASNSFESIATVSLSSSGTVSFTNIPQTYTHLELRFIAQGSAGNIPIQFNSSGGTAYSFAYYGGNGASNRQGGAVGQSITYASTNLASSTYFTVGVCRINNYSSTSKTKVVLAEAGSDENGSGTLDVCYGMWNSTNAITSISLSGTYNANSRFALYGIKGA